jgi:hypothetical protein
VETTQIYLDPNLALKEEILVKLDHQMAASVAISNLMIDSWPF